jgi:hypothetical protein
MTPAQQAQLTAQALTLEITDKEIMADLLWPASATEEEVRARFDALDPPQLR